MTTDLQSLIAHAKAQKFPSILLLDGLEDPRNFGAILRTAEATNIAGVVIPKKRSVSVTEIVKQTSTGASDLVPIATVSNLNQTIALLKQEGFWIVGLEADGETRYTDIDYKLPTAFVIGSEGNGLSRLVRENCDLTVSIPMLGQISSLNVSVATAIILYEAVRQRYEQKTSGKLKS